MIQQMKKIERHERILSTLDKMQYATVKQINRVNSLSSDRNCYRILKQLEQDKLVKHIKREMNIYYLGKEGKELIGSEKDLPKHQFIDHILMRNDLFIYLGNPPTWKIEHKIDDHIIADAFFKKPRKDSKLQDRFYIEIDHTQPMRENRKKLQIYEKLNEAHKKQYGYEFKVIYLTFSEIRKKNLEKAAKVPIEVYTVNDIK